MILPSFLDSKDFGHGFCARSGLEALDDVMMEVDLGERQIFSDLAETSRENVENAAKSELTHHESYGSMVNHHKST